MREHMNGAQPSNGPSGPLERVWAQKWSFLAVFGLTLFLVVQVAASTGFIPDSSGDGQQADADGTTVQTPDTLGATAAEAAVDDSGVAAPENGQLNMDGELPTRVVIPSINVDTPVDNPATLDVNALNNYLLSAAVRYPTSATLDQQGNVIIFGHSSYLPVVINQHFKTFDGIQNLTPGELIYIYSDEHEFTYSVVSEQKESELSDSIPLTTTGHTLTLATCDSFTTTTDRFIVTAMLVGSSALTN